ncbi:MAG: type II toxin-antitoxin system Phd/YefM family antitoxin [Acidimicrobiales bacterium]
MDDTTRFPSPVDRARLDSGADHVGIRELRNQVAAVVRRAASGDDVVVTVDGRPVARLVPLEPQGRATLDDLVAAGLVEPPGRADRPPPPPPAMVPIDLDIDAVLDEIRR